MSAAPTTISGAASAAPEFPRTLAAVQAAEGDRWTIADAVLWEIGPPPLHGVKDGSSARLLECSEYLAQRGFEYEIESLRNLRDTAHYFPEGCRDPSCSFTAHQVARSPEVLGEAIRRSGGAPPTGRMIRDLRREMAAASARAERERHEAERARHERKAEAERRKADEAQRRVDEARRRGEEARREQQAAERAEQRAVQARLRAAEAEREQERAERKRAERERRDAETNAARAAALLEEHGAAEAFVASYTSGHLKVEAAIHRREQKTKERTRDQPEPKGLPLPALVYSVILKMGEWLEGLKLIEPELADLPEGAERDLVEQKLEAHRDQCDRCLAAMRGTQRPDLHVIEGHAAGGIAG